MPESTAHLVLAAIEQLQPDSTGAFVIELVDGSVGTVFVERNRVCWAAYTGLPRHQRNLLREYLAWAHDELSREEAKTEAMRRALKEHTVGSLVAIPQDQEATIEWVEHRNQGYQPRFTFSPAELTVAVNAQYYANEAEGSEAALAIVQDGCAATYVPADGGGLIAVRMSGGDMTIAELAELGSWADAAFAVTRGFSREVMYRALDAATGQVCVAWRTSRSHTHAAVLERNPVLERLVATLTHDNVPSIISRRGLRS